MQYKNVRDFESFLSSSKRGGNPRVFLVSMSSSAERSKVYQKIINELAEKEHTIERLTPTNEIVTILDSLVSPSLFGGQIVSILDESDLLKKKDLDVLGTFIEKNNLAGIFLIGAKEKSPLIKIVERVGAVLDMSGEKPWEKQKRVQEELLGIAKEQGKWLSKDAAILLTERIGEDLSFLSKELEKLICFVGQRQNIERSDVFRISGEIANDTPWKVAEEIIWERSCSDFDPAGFFGIIFSLRTQLEIGLKIADLLQANIPMHNWSAYFPKVWPKTLEKRRDQVEKAGVNYFKKGLELLYKIEALSRTSSNPPEDLFDLFRISLIKG